MPVDVSPELERIIIKSLEKDRQLRYQHADLQRLRRETTSGQTPVVAIDVGHMRWWRNRKTILGVVAAVLALAGMTFFLFRARHVQALTEKDTILLTDFTNTTGDGVFDSALKQASTVQLQQSPFLNIFPAERVRETLRFMGRSPDERVAGPVGREVCQRNGIKAMIAGEISQLGTEYVLNLTATNCLTGDSLAQEQEQAAGKEHVLNALGESLSSVQRFNAPVRMAADQQCAPLTRSIRLLSRQAGNVELPTRSLGIL